MLLFDPEQPTCFFSVQRMQVSWVYARKAWRDISLYLCTF
jgi:hypothetical protein